MNYEQTLHYLYNKLPLYSNIGIKAYKADLKNTRALCEFLGNPQDRIKTIHVAGTNGKGSTSHMLASVFSESGYKTGLYTSPHLKDFRERIKVNGNMISRDFIIEFLDRTRAFSEQINPSFFELTFVMALEYFAQQNTEIAIIETGLGGRLDSTNVISPEISVITNIGMDHMDILGDTLAKIAVEKAGIIKKEIPVVIGETIPETKQVFVEYAKKNRAPLFFAEEKYAVIAAIAENEILHVEVSDIATKLKKTFSLDLAGLYQAKNLCTVLTALEVLHPKFNLKEEQIKKGLSRAGFISGLHGRWEIIQNNPMIILDVAHNLDCMRLVIHQIQNSRYDKLHIVIGMVKDKEIEKILEILPQAASYYFTRAQIPRALPETELLERAKKTCLEGSSFSTVHEALETAKRNAGEGDMILVCGSVFVVGEVS